jgi:cytochrome c oxidase subunit 2
MESGNFSYQVDPVFIFVMAVSIFFIVGITATMLFFLFRYNKKRNKVAKDIHGHAGLEIIWTLIPLILVTIMFYFGWVGFKKIVNPPADAMNIQATGRMWSWLFEYENGVQTDTLYVPVNKPVKLTLNSLDVIHSFYIPAFRVKKDVVPGKIKNVLWFAADEVGSYDAFCAEYCGQRHSYMLTKVVAMPGDNFEKWYTDAGSQIQTMTTTKERGETAAPSSQRGLMLIKTKGGCIACHSLDGSKLVGPTFKGIFKRQEAVLVYGQEQQVIADEAYLRKSMINPAVQVVKGYPAVMPPAPLSEEEIEEVITYLKELK